MRQQRDKTGVTFLSSNMSGSRVPVTMRDFFFDDPFFKNTWEDFDKVRDAMFNESRDMWKKFDDDFRNMACMSNNIMLESSARGAEEAAQEKEKEVSQYRPDELKVCVNDGVLVVEGKHEITDAAGLQVAVGERVDVPAEVDAARPQHGPPLQHGHLQGQKGQRGHPRQGGRGQDGGEPGHQPVPAGRAEGLRE